MEKKYRIKNLCCANCAAEMERKIQKLQGVHSASIAFMTQMLFIDADESRLSEILDAADDIIKKIEPDCRIVR